MGSHSLSLGTGPRRRWAALAVAATAVLSLLPLAMANSAGAAPELLSQGKPVTASSSEGASTPAAAAVDGNTTTRWSSTFSDPQWIQVDLGSTKAISQVVLQWEAAYATAFKIQTAATATGPYTDVYSTTTATGGTQTLPVNGSGRFVRLYGTARNGGYGYSLFEFQVYGGTAATPTPTPTVTPTSPAGCATGTNIAKGKAVTATSEENYGTPATNAVDGNLGSRWSSAATDPQSITVDLGASQAICQVTLAWEAAYAKAFQVQVSSSPTSGFTDVYSTTTGTGGTQTIAVSGTGRYVRMLGTVRATGYGYSLWELSVFGGTGSTTTPTPTPTPTATPTATPTPTPTPTPTDSSVPVPPTDPKNPAFGPNVSIFDPTMALSTIQSKLSSVFASQETNQFGDQRFALMFKPGNYDGLDANIGFYTSIAGLGINPDDVNINGHVRVEADWAGGNATLNFWRSAENLSVSPTDGWDRWAVAQAAPYRRMHLKGNVRLWNGYDGWASGGLFADTKVDGQVVSGSQQQWSSRNSEYGSWAGSVWNMVFVGTKGAPAQSFPNPAITTVDTTPVMREKPFLYIDGAGSYNVFVPSLRTNTQGVDWPNTAGSSISLSQFYVAHPGDSVALLNSALAAGKNLLFTPGIYHVDGTLNVTRANSIVLGLGLATIVNDNGVVPMKVADVDGVQVAGLLFDAGAAKAPQLLQVGAPGSAANHAANPTVLHDVFFRIGGAHVGQVGTALEVNSNNVIGDHMWLWRADHGTGVGWTVNTADNGLVVNGNDVTMHSLFSEHFQKYSALWNGNGGKTYFFQNEMPYDPPNPAAWTDNGHTGYAQYKVADSVTTHEAWGLGVYCVFTADKTLVADRGFEAPVKAGVKFHDLVTESLGGQGTITHVINTTGPTAGPASNNASIVSFP